MKGGSLWGFKWVAPFQTTKKGTDKVNDRVLLQPSESLTRVGTSILSRTKKDMRTGSTPSRYNDRRRTETELPHITPLVPLTQRFPL